MSESQFKNQFVDDIKERLHNTYLFFVTPDPKYFRSIPDLIILGRGTWAALEFKESVKAAHRPNQDWYIDIMKEMGYASFVYPENAEEVLDDLEKLFAS